MIENLLDNARIGPNTLTSSSSTVNTVTPLHGKNAGASAPRLSTYNRFPWPRVIATGCERRCHGYRTLCAVQPKRRHARLLFAPIGRHQQPKAFLWLCVQMVMQYLPTAWIFGIRPGRVKRVSRRSAPARLRRITRIGAHIPEAKGRLERANGTFQHQTGIGTASRRCLYFVRANDVPAAFLPRLNRRFGVPSEQPEVACRPLDEETDLAGVLCIKEQRRVARDNTVRYKNKTSQLFPGTERTGYAGS